MSELEQLLAAKRESDRGNFPLKHDIVGRLMKAKPQDWIVDAPVGKYHGVTHVPTSFRLHMPATHILDGIKRAGEQLLWEAVPVKVAALVQEGSRIKRQVRQVLQSFPKGDTDGTQVYWRPDKQSLAVSFPDGTDEPTKNRWANRLRTLQGVSGVEMDCEWVPIDAVRIKAAALKDVGGIWEGANKVIGGPSPLTNVLVGGLLGGGLGYGAGALAEQVLPEQFERGKLRRTLAAVGAAPFIGHGLWKATANARLDGDGFLNGAVTRDSTPVKRAMDLLADVEIDGTFAKAAMTYAGQFQGGADVKSIPVDAFNQAVWRDVRHGLTAERNPYGSRDAWGDNTPPLHTPQAVGAMTTGIMSGIDARSGGRGWVSPADIVHGLAGAGVGLATATVAGKALGALAGLRPETQQQLQQAGAFGGILMAVVPPLFGR